MPSPRSLVLITVDCLRADHCGFLGYSRPTTPFLDRLAAQSWVFSDAIVAGVPTYYSLPSILASRYPLALGRDIVGLAPDEPTLVSTLKDAGYATACFGAANPYLSRQFGYDRGFETFHDFLDPEANSISPHDGLPEENSNMHSRANQPGSRTNNKLARISARLGMNSLYDELYFQYCQRFAAPAVQSLDSLRPYPTADMIVDQAQAWLASRTEDPFFLWLHLMDPHAPYYPTQEGLAMMGNGSITPSRTRYVNGYWNRRDVEPSKLARQRETLVQLYDAGIRWMDEQVKRLVEILRQLELWEKCGLVFTADHGEEFLEHGGRYHAPSKLAQELLHVPLLLRIPGASPRNVNSLFSLLDLAPTVLDSLGVGSPSAFQGKSRYRQIELRENWNSPALTECISNCQNPFVLQDRMGQRLLCVLEGQYKLVVDFAHREEQLFDLATDPEERLPLPKDAAARTRRRLLEIAHAHIESSSRERNFRFRLATLLRDAKRTITTQSYVDHLQTKAESQECAR
ncbi:MAG: sulfatase [Candidatus Sulfotelmatobacter sp.]